MSYNTDFYKLKKDGELEFMYSMSGSDCPCYYEKIETWKDVEDVFKDIAGDDRALWMSWPNPWRTSKISDDCIIFEEIEREWYELWKPKVSVKAWVGVYYKKTHGKDSDETKMWFSDIPSNEHPSEDYEEPDWKLEHLKEFKLPIMRN